MILPVTGSKCNLEINFVNNKYCDSKRAGDTRIGGYNFVDELCGLEIS